LQDGPSICGGGGRIYGRKSNDGRPNPVVMGRSGSDGLNEAVWRCGCTRRLDEGEATDGGDADLAADEAAFERKRNVSVILPLVQGADYVQTSKTRAVLSGDGDSREGKKEQRDKVDHFGCK